MFVFGRGLVISSRTSVVATGSNVIVLGWLDAVAHPTSRFFTGAHRAPVPVGHVDRRRQRAGRRGREVRDHPPERLRARPAHGHPLARMRAADRGEQRRGGLVVEVRPAARRRGPVEHPRGDGAGRAGVARVGARPQRAVGARDVHAALDVRGHADVASARRDRPRTAPRTVNRPAAAYRAGSIASQVTGAWRRRRRCRPAAPWRGASARCPPGRRSTNSRCPRA